MKYVVQFDPDDLNSIMGWYLTGHVTMQQLVDALNARLREKAVGAPEQPEPTWRGRRPNCF